MIKKSLLFLLLLTFQCLHANEEKPIRSRLSHMVYYVKDVKEALSFYQKVFHLNTQNVDERGFYGELVCGGYVLAFANEELAKAQIPGGFRSLDLNDIPFGCEVGFVTDDVDALYEKALLEGAQSVSPPDRKPWGQIVSYIRDPQGVLVEICQFVKLQKIPDNPSH